MYIEEITSSDIKIGGKLYTAEDKRLIATLNGIR